MAFWAFIWLNFKISQQLEIVSCRGQFVWSTKELDKVLGMFLALPLSLFSPPSLILSLPIHIPFSFPYTHSLLTSPSGEPLKPVDWGSFNPSEHSEGYSVWPSSRVRRGWTGWTAYTDFLPLSLYFLSPMQNYLPSFLYTPFYVSLLYSLFPMYIRWSVLSLSLYSTTASAHYWRARVELEKYMYVQHWTTTAML